MKRINSTPKNVEGGIWVPPENWVQFAHPSKWTDIGITHFRAGATEIDDVETISISLSFARRPIRGLELRDENSRWKAKHYDQGCVAFVPAGVPLSVRWPQTVESINVSVDPLWLRREGCKFESEGLPISTKYGVRDELIAQLIQAIYQDNLNGSPLGAAYAEALTLTALHRWRSLGGTPTGMVARRRDAAMRRAVDYIHAHTDEKISIREIADAVLFEGNLYSFMREFKQYSGKPLHQYALGVRLERAKHLLLTSNANIIDIAFCCGFSSASHFTAVFRRRWGTPPSSLRR